MEEIKKMPKNAEFFCEKCGFVCFKSSNWTSHINTKKHFERTNGNIRNKKEIPTFVCKCGHKCFTNSGLWKHKKKCLSNTKTKREINEICTNDKELIMMLIKENSELKHLIMEQSKETSEFKNMMMEVIKNGTHTHNNTTNNTTYSNNKSFNLNFFLNETCKDAMNIMDFVDSIKLQLSDLENVGKVGFVNGISKIIVKNLKALDEKQRPVHCTDKKREVIYVKDEDKWEKEDTEYKKVRKAIKSIAKKNSKLLFEFKEKHPDCIEGDSKHSDKYSKLLVEAYGGSNNEDEDNENKIIKNITKEVIIDKK
jgi:hypothetical protein